MEYLLAFLFCGFICLIGQLIYDYTTLTPGHITSLFVVIGAFLDTFNIYDRFVEWFGAGALLPITSFGHSLMHGAMVGTIENGFLGIAMGMFDVTADGITRAILLAFIFAILFKPKS